MRLGKHLLHLRTRLTEGRLQTVAGFVYNLIVARELAIERAIDGMSAHRVAQNPALLEKLTAVIKTFERPLALDRLLKSIRRMYPLLHVIVVDDSQDPAPAEGVQTIVLPLDSGVSAGRREGLRHVATEYVMYLCLTMTTCSTATRTSSLR